ncbi:MAG: hypothetical protein NT034_01200 [Candidatus Magasanikbacteria bacterium]|nr:hypothetical protein [Candidatus Magasanikbacteria bacterium]
MSHVKLSLDPFNFSHARYTMTAFISEFERGVLSSLLGHKRTQVLWRINSRQACILGIREAGRRHWVVKMPGWRILEALTPEERAANTVMMNRLTVELQTRLSELGLKLPDCYRVMEINGFPVHQSSDHGEDCEQIVRRSPAELTNILHQIICGLNGVFERGEGKVGVEARLSNFALSKEGKVVYIDLFPPLIYYDGHYVVHFPNPTTKAEIEIEIERKFRPFGILRRMRCDLLAINPAWDEPFFQALNEVKNPILRDELKERFRNLPDQCVGHLSASRLEGLIRSLPSGDADTRREIAARVLPVNKVRDQTMHQVFDNTSHVGLSNKERQARQEKFLRIIRPYM